MILTLNFVSGVVAVLMMLLVLRGVLPHSLPPTAGIRHFREWWAVRGPGELVRLAVALFHIKTTWRISEYDVWYFVSKWLSGAAVSRPTDVAVQNTGFAVIAILGAYIVLVALYRNIPEEDRVRYSPWSAPCYPEPAPWRFRLR